MQKLWEIKPQDLASQQKLAASLNISPITCQLLINRGIKLHSEADEFLRCDLRSLPDPFLLKDMDVALARIKKAISREELIIVYADYDVDGITGCVLLIKVLSELGAKLAHYIPDRIREGYGLNKAGIDWAHQRGASLLVTTDCGITANNEIDYARSLGIDVIVIDHHRPIDSLPNALAIIDPKRSDSTYPYKGLSGVGLTFRLVQALTEEDRWEDLDLVTLGTVADIAPMTGDNRILTKHGLMWLNKTRSVGIKALMDVAGLVGKCITTGDIGYILGPRINAIGRLGSAESALKLLLSTSTDEASSLSRILDRANRERQNIECQTLEEVLAKVEKEVNFKSHKVIVLWDENWHLGVIGIVASRVAGKYYRPTIIISLSDGKGKGSGRSIENFHLFNALKSCEDFLEGYGGHKLAVGLTIAIDKLVGFRQMINSVASLVLGPQDLMPKVNIDSEIPLSSLTTELIEEIETLGPFGPRNPRPVFLSRNLSLKSSPEVIGKSGLRMWVTDQKITCEAICRNAQDVPLPADLTATSQLQLVYSPSIYYWQGKALIRLEIKDARVG